MRSEGGNASEKADCDDPAIALACSLESDSCPAECKASDEKDEPTVVKSGDLAVSAEAAEGRKALIGGVSDLDTITFKTSEDVTISSITLERYGYSTKEQVDTVQLEDEDGNIIADAKEINNKGQVKLTLKKDYKTVDGTFKATIVLTTKDLGTNNGSTIGFKVISAESTAKNLNLDDYSPYTYDLVNYKGSAVQFSSRNSATKDYNWEAGELYEVAKFRAKSPADATILVKGFTLTDNNKNNIEADKYAKDVIVTVNGKEVSGLKWNINKDDELVVSFSEVEVAAKETATFAVKMSFNEEFDNFGQSATYYIKKLANFNAIDKKTETRVSEDATLSIANLATKVGQANGWTTYTFKGGKVKLSGTKLGTVNAAANSTNVKVAEGEMTITEALRGTARLAVASNDIIDEIRLVIDGEEYDGSKITPMAYTGTHIYNTGAYVLSGGNIYVAAAKGAGTTVCVADNKLGVSVYEFKGLEIEKSGKIEVRVDVKDGENLGTMTFNSLNSKSFDLKYDESGEEVGNQIVGSISVSNLKAQAAKASLDKGSTKEAELILKETNRKTIFEGTYTAKNGAVTLKNFVITKVSGTEIAPAPTFYVTIGSEEIDADWSTTEHKAKNDIDDIEVADGKSVNVKVEIDVVPTDENAGVIYNIALEGEDEDNNKAGEADEDTVKVKVVKQGSIQVTDASAKKTILLKSNRDVAVFKIKPSKSGDEDVVLKSLSFHWYDDAAATSLTGLGELKIDIDGDKYTVGGSNPIITDTAGSGTISPDKTIPAEGILVTVSLKSELADTDSTSKRAFKLESINGNANVATTFSKYWVPAKIVNLKQSKNGDSTRYTFDIDNDGSDTVSLMKFYTGTAVTLGADCLPTAGGDTVVSEKETISEKDNSMKALNAEKAENIKTISYKVGNKCVLIKYAEFEDFFDLGDEDLMVYSNKSN